MDGNKADNPEGPLSSEALKRDEWRGRDGAQKPDAGDADEDRAEGPNPIAGTMLPPD